MRSIEGFSLFIFHLNEENNSWWVNSIFYLLYTKAKQISDKRIDWEIANFRNAMKCTYSCTWHHHKDQYLPYLHCSGCNRSIEIIIEQWITTKNAFYWILFSFESQCYALLISIQYFIKNQYKCSLNQHKR